MRNYVALVLLLFATAMGAQAAQYNESNYWEAEIATVQVLGSLDQDDNSIVYPMAIIEDNSEVLITYRWVSGSTDEVKNDAVAIIAIYATMVQSFEPGTIGDLRVEATEKNGNMCVMTFDYEDAENLDTSDNLEMEIAVQEYLTSIKQM